MAIFGHKYGLLQENSRHKVKKNTKNIDKTMYTRQR